MECKVSLADGICSNWNFQLVFIVELNCWTGSARRWPLATLDDVQHSFEPNRPAESSAKQFQGPAWLDFPCVLPRQFRLGGSRAGRTERLPPGYLPKVDQLHARCRLRQRGQRRAVLERSRAGRRVVRARPVSQQGRAERGGCPRAGERCLQLCRPGQVFRGVCRRADPHRKCWFERGRSLFESGGFEEGVARHCTVRYSKGSGFVK